MSLLVLLGGARSGKSALALRVAAGSGRPVTFVATARESGDAEWSARIERHRAERPAQWATVEEPVELRAALEAAPANACVVVDCLSLWVANLLEERAPEEIELVAAEAAAAAAARTAPTVAVSNEVGLGVVPATPLGRLYRDVLGRVNREWVDAAERSALVVAGRPLRLDRAESLL